MDPIVDSSLTIEEALRGKDIPEDIYATLRIAEVRYRSFDGDLHQGQLVVHESVLHEVEEIFEELLRLSFPIQRVLPICAYDWDDEESMADNNTSAFNFRTVAGTDRLSNHALGFAIDINPFLNPCERANSEIVPKGASYQAERSGTLAPESDAVRSFTSRGWDWGGTWEDKDWQHFSKLPRT